MTLLFADIAGSTRLYDTLGGLKATETINRSLKRLEALARANNGSAIKTIGDAVLCTFPRPDDAAKAAVEMHEAATFDPTMAQAGIHLRIGFHHGEVICGKGDVFGDAVNMAARMMALAKSDQILTNRETLSRMAESLKQQMRMIDRTRIPGKDDLMEIHELVWGRLEQMTVSSSMTEQLIEALTAEQDYLQIQYQQARMLINNDHPTLTMGRDLANHLVVSHPLVSRVHARIELQRNRFMLIDQSTNGTFIKPVGQPPRLLRRDNFQLEGKGVIGLGQKVTQNHAMALHYQLL